MNQKRYQYLYKFLGVIENKKKRTNPKHEQYFYQLKVKLAGQSPLQKIFVFRHKTKPLIWKALEADAYLGKQYLFHCRNHWGDYYLVDWEEIKDEK